jgi:hypothetical protein
MQLGAHDLVGIIREVGADTGTALQVRVADGRGLELAALGAGRGTFDDVLGLA